MKCVQTILNLFMKLIMSNAQTTVTKEAVQTPAVSRTKWAETNLPHWSPCCGERGISSYMNTMAP